MKRAVVLVALKPGVGLGITSVYQTRVGPPLAAETPAAVEADAVIRLPVPPAAETCRSSL